VPAPWSTSAPRKAAASRPTPTGKAVDFAGNEKCAAGAGSFAEAMSRALQMTLKEFGEASLQARTSRSR
jgi:activator of 2-hydroxyglutaryl-CoA dehydratase